MIIPVCWVRNACWASPPRLDSRIEVLILVVEVDPPLEDVLGGLAVEVRLRRASAPPVLVVHERRVLLSEPGLDEPRVVRERHPLVDDALAGERVRGVRDALIRRGRGVRIQSGLLEGVPVVHHNRVTGVERHRIQLPVDAVEVQHRVEEVVEVDAIARNDVLDRDERLAVDRQLRSDLEDLRERRRVPGTHRRRRRVEVVPVTVSGRRFDGDPVALLLEVVHDVVDALREVAPHRVPELNRDGFALTRPHRRSAGVSTRVSTRIAPGIAARVAAAVLTRTPCESRDGRCACTFEELPSGFFWHHLYSLYDYILHTKFFGIFYIYRCIGALLRRV